MADRNITKSLYLRQIARGNVKYSFFQNHCTNLGLTFYMQGGTLFSRDKIKVMDTDSTGRFLVVGTSKGCLSLIDLWKYDTGCININEQRELKFNSTLIASSVESVKWAPHSDGLFVSGGVDKKVTVWDAEEFVPLEQFILFTSVHQVAVSKAGGIAQSLIAAALRQDNVKVIDLKSGQFTHELRGLSVGSVSCAWSPIKEHVIAAGSYGCKVKIWDIRSSDSCLAELEVEKDTVTEYNNSLVNGVIFSPRGRNLVVSCDSTISSWDSENLKNLYHKVEPVPTRKKKSLHFQVAECGGFEACFVPSYNSLVVINLNTGETLTSLKGHIGNCNCVDFNSKTLNLYSGGDDSNVMLWSSLVKSNVSPDS